MEFRDLKTQYSFLKKEIDTEILKVASECNFISGTQVKKLEEELSRYVGVKHCITCANGTDALSLAMMTWKIGKGDAVFVPDFTFFSSGEIVSHAGATPVFVDVDKDTFNISALELENQIEKTVKEGKLVPKVIIAVDLFGLPANYKKIREIADRHGLYILEDGAQGFGGEIEGKRACSFGDISTTSFFPAKPLGCYGDGGAVFTDNDEWAELLDSIRVHGKGDMKYDNVRIGLNSRLDTIQAGILSVKLKAFYGYEVSNINKVAELYSKELKETVRIPAVPNGYGSSWAQYTIKLKNKEERDYLKSVLEDNKIPCMVYYPKPMHKQQAFKKHCFNEKDYSTTITLCDTVLSLPIHPYLTEREVSEVCEVIKMALTK